MSLWLARRGEMRGLTHLLVLSMVVSGVALMLSMSFSNIYIAGAFLVVMGAYMLVGNVAAQTLVQNSVEPAFRARALGLFIIFAYGFPAIGAVIMGWIAGYIGLRWTIGGGAFFMLLFWIWALPQKNAIARRLERE